MKLIIHRGTKEIGGICVEFQSKISRILFDFGTPLVDENNYQFDFRKLNNKTKEYLILQGILPKIEGLYKDEHPLIDAILLSHPHQDHYGLLSYVNSEIPIYMSQGCKELIEVSYFFEQTNYHLKNFITVKTWQRFKIGNFKITSYLVDHSGFDALAFLIESEGKRVFCSGDFRGHGKKSILFDNLLKNPPKNIDYLILEGSIINRDEGKYETEEDIENELTKIFKSNNNLFFVTFSSQNIDRIVTIYKSCLRSNRIFVIDPYTAFILDRVKKISPNIPQYNWGQNIRIFFVPNRYTQKMAEGKILFKFKSAKISYEEMQKMRNTIVIKDSYIVRNIFARKKNIENSRLIYSMWEGYLSESKKFWDKYNVPIIKIHSSGHAYIKELQKFVNAIKPKHIIPYHTFYPDKYFEYFGDNIKIIKDKEVVKL